MALKRCTKCKQWKDENEFSWRKRILGIRQTKCKDCISEENRDFYENSKERTKDRRWQRQVDKREEARHFVYTYLSNSRCVDCGEADPLVLTFDHVVGRKRNDISQMVNQGYSIHSIQEEIAKCDVVCANCHMRREKKRRGTRYWNWILTLLLTLLLISSVLSWQGNRRHD